ncbi:hypothetical protein GCM10022377_17940 [Zhihengliuella alba]|uniref:Uncharacterized protein n=1 Tax=Zhihengliuella alba TaxID=547018 RepID=A0ABP7DHM7_9MICC
MPSAGAPCPPECAAESGAGSGAVGPHAVRAREPITSATATAAARAGAREPLRWALRDGALLLFTGGTGRAEDGRTKDGFCSAGRWTARAGAVWDMVVLSSEVVVGRRGRAAGAVAGQVVRRRIGGTGERPTSD